jgi:prolyl-tRNA editing enzyme YbaK/EbsC (Cys-tRNA(Pro) deacylase)
MTDPSPKSRLNWVPVAAEPELLAPPVREGLRSWNGANDALVAPIDPGLADTAQFCDTYGISPAESANCVVVSGKREGQARFAACVVLATTRADVNGVVRRLLDVRKASFADIAEAVSMTGMAYGGITPVGLPADWPVFVAGQVLGAEWVVIGSGIRGSKLRVRSEALLRLPGARAVSELAREVVTESAG